MNLQRNIWDLVARVKREFPFDSTVFPNQNDADWVQGTVLRHVILNTVNEILLIVMTANCGEIAIFPSELSTHDI